MWYNEGGGNMEDNNLKDWLEKNGHKLKIAYSYAVVNKLNIKSKEDVLKFKSYNPDNANEEQWILLKDVATVCS